MPRMLVEPRRIRDGQLTGCTGATMEDGSVYLANKRGHIEVDDVAHARAMVSNPLAPGHVLEATFNGAGVSGITCASCSFGAFRWQKSRPCPKCGADDWEET